MSINNMINLKKNPIHIKGVERDKIVKKARKDLEHDGCAIIKNFLTQNAIKLLVQEANGVVNKAHFSYNRTNPYFTQDDPTLNKSDPRRKFYNRSNGFIPADNFRKDGALRGIHDFLYFDEFIKDCLNEKKFSRYADPLADVIINVANEGNGFPWHFDTNNFTVTLAIQNAVSGGIFQYVPNIRKKNENFDEVSKVLNGKSDKIVSINLKPGDLQLFKGRYSLHRVSPLKGKLNRYVAIFSYVEEAGMVGSPERTKQLYGKVLPIHFDRAGIRNDKFID